MLVGLGRSSRYRSSSSCSRRVSALVLVASKMTVVGRVRSRGLVAGKVSPRIA